MYRLSAPLPAPGRLQPSRPYADVVSKALCPGSSGTRDEPDTEEEDAVGDPDEGIVLTDREREALAGLAESIGDPWLARQLAGGEQTPAQSRRRPARIPRLGLRLQAV